MRLMEGMPLPNEVKVQGNMTATRQIGTSASYLGPFEDSLLEADQLRSVSERLETLMNKHDGIEQLESVAGSIRGIAAVFDVFTLIRSKAGTLEDDATEVPTTGYVN